jgi:hypothetical protein
MVSVLSKTIETKSSETDAAASLKTFLYWDNGIKSEDKQNVPFQISS